MTSRISDPNVPSAELLDRYFASECTPTEQRWVRAWAAARADRETGLEELRQLRALDRAPVWDVNIGWHDIAARIDAQQLQVQAAAQRTAAAHPQYTRRDKVKQSSVQHQHRSPRVVWTVASAILLAALLLISGWHSGIRLVSAHSSNDVLTYATGDGQRASITLPDGSQVVLNVASRLEVPTDYERGNHTLHLRGEALFTVIHHDGTPFTVIAGPSTTRVLGTSFVVRHYDTDPTAFVAVRDGKVAVRSMIVTADQQISVGDHILASIHPATPGTFTFATGVLTLDGMSLRDAIPELDRWYNADLQLGDPSLATRQIAGGFTAGSLTDLAEILEMTFDLRVVRTGRVLTLYPRG